ncbi:hypothetical protein OIU78_011702 [Salix suchowensis]|nr:hypothetical protein OIU78_011702 [Salix suchowensis]
MHKSRFLNFSRGYLHSAVKSNEFSYSRIESNRVLKDLSKAGRIDDARNLFDKMLDRDDFSWNTMVAGYANSGRFTEAEKLFYETPVKSSITWTGLISGYCKYGFENEAFELFWEMKLQGQSPSQYTLGSVLGLCSTKGLLQKGEQIHGYAIKTWFDWNVFVVTGLVDMYGNCKCVFEAECLFEMVADCKYNAVWSAMLAGYSHYGYGYKAIECFRNMRTEGVESNQFTFPSILRACGAVMACNFGSQVHGCIVRTGFGANIFVRSALVDMYAKCGDLNSAKSVLENMEFDDEVSWNSMILGCVRQGFEEEALSFFQKMLSRNMKIDEYTLPSVLNSFASMKDMQNAISVHCLIIKTGFEAYKLVNNALIDMYAKQGKLDCAIMAFSKMVDKDVVSWTSLVTGYSHNGSYEEAIKLFCKMIVSGVYPDQIAVASVLSACAELTVLRFGQQIHATLVKSGLGSSLSVDNSLVTMGIWKEPGYSWIETNSKVDTFMSEDRRHPLRAEIYSKIDEIIMLIKEAGYVPDMSFALHDTDVEVKELGLAYHSEKLALAFGLLTVPRGAPIRIFKNLRVCGDCHTAMKYTSKVYARHIILRDSNCFHHFIQGRCSCGDYW